MIKVFEYMEELDCFIVAPEYKRIANYLGLSEWNEVVWIGRYFILDNDYGEHWFDNWELRKKISNKALELGLDETELFVVDPSRFENGKDGPRHSDEERKLFWTDVLLSLHLSIETLIREARRLNIEREDIDDDEYIPDLEQRILSITTGP